ncbi:hypothetical protein TKK_0011801 [Trichogramma kaykai]|uniref:Uncharacterized protein n=1 Tax=Trichogramma kaykai TaxID=54128 RepID=A0ABD2WQA0_9HYME
MCFWCFQSSNCFWDPRMMMPCPRFALRPPPAIPSICSNCNKEYRGPPRRFPSFMNYRRRLAVDKKRCGRDDKKLISDDHRKKIIGHLEILVDTLRNEKGYEETLETSKKLLEMLRNVDYKTNLSEQSQARLSALFTRFCKLKNVTSNDSANKATPAEALRKFRECGRIQQQQHLQQPSSPAVHQVEES